MPHVFESKAVTVCGLLHVLQSSATASSICEPIYHIWYLLLLSGFSSGSEMRGETSVAIAMDTNTYTIISRK